jgi:penicillin-binding protein 1C
VWKKRLKITALTGAAAFALFAGTTLICLQPVTKSFDRITADSRNVPVRDRTGVPLAITYQAAWNNADSIALYAMPELLVKAFVFSEDRKFYDHHGVDWAARGAALWQNIRMRKTVRGASTITEQVVRLINPRPRNLWSKWLEGIEATLLETHTDKASILEFYMNQLPYAAHRRGVAQAARYYFNRDLETLSTKEMLALAVLARAPSAYDLYRNAGAIDKPLARLAAQMNLNTDIAAQSLAPLKPSLPVEARHFARFVALQGQNNLPTTLDASLQNRVQDILDARLKKLGPKHVTNAGALVIDHTNGDILAWVVAGARDDKTKGGDIDTILTARQPGSTLKPFLYAAALEKGWTAATILNDAPIAEAVGSGLHRFRNYSGAHYGPITLREALGNSLNIPAVLTVSYVGVDPFLNDLHKLGFDSLDRGADVYDEGLALGNGEVTLYELTRAYGALANRGTARPLRTSLRDNAVKGQKVYTAETASIIGNILSDPRARALEFGSDSILNLPVRTAAKTGTSTDYRDAWTVAYNDRYAVGIWMGNLDRTPMKDVTGSTGPALAMRSIFQILNADRDTKSLYLAPSLIEHDICTRPSADPDTCPRRTELFTADAHIEDTQLAPKPSRIELVRPTAGLMMAYDPRVPADHQKFRFELAGLNAGEEVEWVLDGKPLARTSDPKYLWPLVKGPHSLAVTIHGPDTAGPKSLDPVRFTVR